MDTIQPLPSEPSILNVPPNWKAMRLNTSVKPSPILPLPRSVVKKAPEPSPGFPQISLARGLVSEYSNDSLYAALVKQSAPSVVSQSMDQRILNHFHQH